jgi:hypothetical protein
MPAPLRITLTEEEDRTLSELRQAQSVPYRTRDRAGTVLLKSEGQCRFSRSRFTRCKFVRCQP